MRYKNYQELEASARNLARQRNITVQQAIAEELQDNPEIYAAYRAEHNIGAIARSLGLTKKP